ncbi:MAG: hypothetical protein LWX56_07765 [Ignavibacteria bacterium]|nr:hypothetical protein [Ignavibacteria bacterium]
MKKLQLFVLVYVFILAGSYSTIIAQDRPHNGNLKKLDQLEKVKIIEELNLDESTSAKFFIRFKDFKLRQRKLNTELDSLAIEIENQLNQKGSPVVLKKLIGEYQRTESAFHKSRTDFVNGVSDILSTEQVAKLLVFERKFRKELQKMMLEQGRGWQHGKRGKETE